MWPLFLVTLLWAECDAAPAAAAAQSEWPIFDQSSDDKHWNGIGGNAEWKSLRHPQTDRLTLSTFEPRFAINLGVVGPISAPLFQFLDLEHPLLHEETERNLKAL